MTLPPITAITFATDSQPDSPLTDTLRSLLEPSQVLTSTLVPQIHQKLQSSSLLLSSYAQLIDMAISQVRSWDTDLQAQFISGHPRIGETKNLSSFSAKEQGASSLTTALTSPDVLERLAYLNAYYERRYPKLVYIIFVNGRSRVEIVRVLEDHLGLEHSLSTEEPPLNTVIPVEIGSKEWLEELERAVIDVGLIAKSRLKALSVE
ncbi:Oxo-4-hydroxy-4-carboxy-5-ureidoimidazoline decarboxylase [Rhodocollybia butyracea]|uniref:Oxo-4-hydroxy-4-carboxy-5-ureidoimidazoline decarboxylase n=1 Tax=Rhodocollybia butyracea TaxID=206335 RepID=A0A9P5PUU8_9AGAR|nr:Oxo-4-hydroxy-4-carboxy-5-ureidoimidazoline decarboxylase [Rhodocollybia butyracea]